MGCCPSSANHMVHDGAVRSPVSPGHIVAKEDHHPFPEQTDVELPVGKFTGGNLGVTVQNTINVLKSRLLQDELFTDSNFPPNEQSLYFADDKRDPKIEWKRPHEIVENPELIVKGVCRRDVVQGDLGDCWFLSSCASVARNPKLIEKVISKDQALFGSDYQGIIIVHFWRFGSWITVMIDDFLPTKEGKLIYAHSESENEFWIALVEKAYAKIHGTYQGLEGGYSMDAMVDLTGGLPYYCHMSEVADDKELYNTLTVATNCGAFITAGTEGDWKESCTKQSGLLEGHAYAVIDEAIVSHPKLGTVPLIKFRNPWGDSEWKGAWSDGDELWDDFEADTKLKLEDKDDGEFWMSFDDFCKEYEQIHYCWLESDDDVEKDGPNVVKAVKGSWVKGKSAGGCQNDWASFLTNPQILLTLYADSGEVMEQNSDGTIGRGTQEVQIGLMQEHRRSKREETVTMNSIGFCVYKVSSHIRRISPLDTLNITSAFNTGNYINYREVISILKLDPGNYIIIPAIFEPDIADDFLLRVHSSKRFDLRKIY